MDEEAAVEKACADMLAQMTGNFLQALIEAQGNAPKIAAAEATLKAGIVFVRGARQRAVALLA